MENALERIETALGAMASAGPRVLRAYLERPGPDFEKASPGEVDFLVDLLLSKDPNEPARLRFSSLLRSWDNAKDAIWVGATARNTASRRKLIHQKLKSDEELEKRVDELLPFYHLAEPLIISEVHEDWYVPRLGHRDYYWGKYIQYLKERRRLEDVSILSIDNSTRAIVECLSNPESPRAYAARGLVMGYVQSGKTANFAGVVARAADAGYRLIIVLAGTWNILRTQTQRRFDKELLGKELLKNDEAYAANPPRDWDMFLEHGADPVELGQYTWQRLTRPNIDFLGLKAAINALEYEKANKAAPLYHPSNLHALPVKLLVIKKHSGIISKLCRDLKTLSHTQLAELPALIIDDESDQAGLNVYQAKKEDGTNPKPEKNKKIKRSPTNDAIVELLRLLPRAQYVGYTATPYANALINPDDPEDLFPKDFIISLDRPAGYMGISDFFDPETAYEDLKKDDYSLPEIAYIRRIENPRDGDDDDLKQALQSYVLAGSIKLYRHTKDPQRYKAEDLQHHTMLVHTTPLTGPQGEVAERINNLWAECAFNSSQGFRSLEALWKDEYSLVCAAAGNDLTPGSFRELVAHLTETINRIEKGGKICVLVNKDNPSAPDFSAAPVWKVFVGGNKLSRGYTVEGLTVSYYRRVAGTGDTLMQMGRWFGFRPGYQDLVRVFLGVKEGRKGDTDLVADFKDVCRMEERFRDEIKRYIRKAGTQRITPRDIPPLISISGNLPPVARNKMFNAVLDKKNFGGQPSMLTKTAAKPGAMKENRETAEAFLKSAEALGRTLLGGISTNGKPLEATAVLLEAGNGEIVKFLKEYRWLESDYKEKGKRPLDTNLQIEFLTKEKHEISSWLIVAPQRVDSFGERLKFGKVELAVKRRRRIEGRGFQVFGEPQHRAIAYYLMGIKTEGAMLTHANDATKSLQNRHRGVMLLYPVRENESGDVTIGFELFFPENKLPFELGIRARKKTDAITVDASAPK